MVKNARKEICQRVPDAHAAEELGVCVAYMHQQMRRGLWDLGEVIPPSKKAGRTNYAYHIYREKLDRHLYGNGKTIREIEELKKQNLKMIKLEALEAGYAIGQLEKDLEECHPAQHLSDKMKDCIGKLSLAIEKIEVLAE